MDSKCIWLTGLPSAGKTTLAVGLEQNLTARKINCIHLDGDIIRKGLNSDLGFSLADRKENIRRVAELCRLLLEHNTITICSFIAPTVEIREIAKSIIGSGKFFEVFIDTPKEICALRDPKGLYAKAFKGEIKEFTGVSDPYEAPVDPELTINTHEQTLDESVAQIISYLEARELVPQAQIAD